MLTFRDRVDKIITRYTKYLYILARPEEGTVYIILLKVKNQGRVTS